MRKRICSCSGQSVVEFALLLPMLFLLVVNVVNFGGLLYAYLTVANAARTGASYLSMGSSSAFAPVLPSASAVHDLVTADLSSLPNASDATVAVCGKNNTLVKWPPVSSGTTCTLPSNPPTGSSYADPQPTLNILGTVQVQYTYCPFIASWNFPGLGIYSTLPSCTTDAQNNISGGTTITRVAAMRILQ